MTRAVLLLAVSLAACKRGEARPPPRSDDCTAILADVMRADPFNALSRGCPINREFTESPSHCAPPGLTPTASTCAPVELGAPLPFTLDVDQWFPAAMFSEPDAYAMCRDIFDEEFLATMRRIPPLTDAELSARWDWVDPSPLDEIQRGMLSVLARITLRNCNEIRYGHTFAHRVHGEFDPATWTATVYASACSAQTIYGDDGVASMNYAYRYVLVQSHEVGHAIDALTGDLLQDDPGLCAERENRATIYGSYIARCMSRLLRDVIESSEYDDAIAAQLPDSSKEYFQQVHVCIGRKWAEYEHELASISKRAGARRDLKTAAEVATLNKTIACEGL